MQMIRNILLILFLFCCLESGAQEAPPGSALQHELGINATFLIKTALQADEPTTSGSPYLLTYKLLFPKMALRLGGGGSHKKIVTSEEGFADTETQLDYTIDARLGLEWRREVGPHWQINYGFDAMGYTQVNKVINDSGFDEVTLGESLTGIGAGPVLGFQFFLTPHLSLYTEGAFYYTFSERKTSRIFKNFPQFDDEINKMEEQELLIYLPASLYLVYRF